MKKLLILALLPLTVHAASYMVYYHTQDVRVVLSTTKCGMQGFKGSEAALQTVNNRFVRGCWYQVDNGENVRIDWNNPAVPGDFAVIPLKSFSPASE